MEFAAVAALAAYGWYSANSKDAVTKAKPTYSYADPLDDTIRPPSELLEDDRRAKARRYQKAKMPKVSGIITPYTRPAALMPNFKSSKTQNSNPDVHQRKVETFTGSATGGSTWKPKAETENMFLPVPRGVVSSSGVVRVSQDAMAEHDAARDVKFQKHNNVLPFEQIRVGTGMGVGPEVAASGGRHQLYRQMPLNINAHKLYEDEGRFNIGGSHVAKPAARSQFNILNDNRRFLSYEDRPPVPGGGHVRAKAISPDVISPPSRRQDITGRVPGGLRAVGTYATYEQGPRGTLAKRERGEPFINQNGARAGVGAYVVTDTTDLRLDQTREQPQEWLAYTSTLRAPPGMQNVLQQSTHREKAYDRLGGNPHVVSDKRLDVRPPRTTLKDLAAVGKPIRHGPARMPTSMETMRTKSCVRTTEKKNTRLGMGNPGRMNLLQDFSLHRAKTEVAHDTLSTALPKAKNPDRADPGKRVRFNKRCESNDERLDLQFSIPRKIKNDLAIDLVDKFSKTK